MKSYKYIACIFMSCIALSSCIDLTETNENPNEITNAGGYLLLSNIQSSSARLYHADNFSGVHIVTAMQYLQVLNKSSECRYYWNNIGWTPHYDILRNNNIMLTNSETNENSFYKGAGLVMRAFLFGYITDLWGDAPYSEALQGDKDIYRPVFDKQEDIYNGILDDLEEANSELAKEIPPHSSTEAAYDLFYGGDNKKWQKMANALALRYYMRLSSKVPEKSKAGIERILGDKNKYPLFEGNNDNSIVSYPGMNQWDSWPGGLLNWADGSDFRRRRPCVTLINKLRDYNDPRLNIWFTPVETQIIVEKENFSYPTNQDTIVGSKRYVHFDAPVMDNGAAYYDTSLYVGLPYNMLETNRFNFNLTDAGDDARNPSLSYLAPRFQANSDNLVNAVFISYSEQCFILAEASLKGWNVGGTAEQYYNKGIEASLAYYKVETGYNSYIERNNVKFNNTLEQIIEQKWISLFLSPESWFDFRRTGFPQLPIANERALHPAIPVRFKYPIEETRNNTVNYNAAIERLEKTSYSDAGQDDHYSKPWVLQGTGKPW